tara:strand:- start:2219 stop:3523 length:1305 start_codon:yes stop_codon:yes gene_type:complete
MNATKTLFNNNLPPLAERVRPKTIKEFYGQEHLTKDNKIINQILKSGKIFSLILWGPPGTGKTTLAKIISENIESAFFQLSAISSGVKQIREIISKAKSNLELGIKSTIFIDEIHRFSKSQQDSLLQSVEDGTISLIGATTENPSFEIIAPLLSRCRVITLKSLDINSLEKILMRAIRSDLILLKKEIKIEKDALNLLFQSSGGDARKMLNTFDISINLIGLNKTVTKKILFEAIQSKTTIYDKKGDYHYDTISAFIKSVRGSDPDAAIYWLAVMIEGGEKPEFIARRLIILSSEDIGTADPQALVIATSGFQAVHLIGLPEAAIILSQVTIYLSCAPKSNSSYKAINNAINTLKNMGTPAVPLHLRNTETNLNKKIEYGKGYLYPHNYKDHFVKENYFPEKNEQQFFYPTEQGYEAWIKKRLSILWDNKFKND